MSTPEPDFVHKLVLLGDSGVGKTSLVQRYVYNSMSTDVAQTLGAILHVKQIRLRNLLHKLVIWDLGGGESFAALREQYCANASGAFMVFDTTRPETFDHVRDWLSALRTRAGAVPVVFVENKIDLETRLDPNKVISLAEKESVRYIQTSAVENRNVEFAFVTLLNSILDRLGVK